MKKDQKTDFLSTRVRYIPINDIRPNPQQPRQKTRAQAQQSQFKNQQRVDVHGGRSALERIQNLLLQEAGSPASRHLGTGFAGPLVSPPARGRE